MSKNSSVSGARQRETAGESLARGRRFAVVAARFNLHVVEPLLRAACALLESHGAAHEDVQVVYVPGAFELPLAALKLASSKRFDAVIALGAVIRGETPHFEFVSGACAQGLLRAGMDTGIPVVFGVLTTDTLEQAMERAGGAHGNKGADAAMTAIEMVRIAADLADSAAR